jgi:hypothetical protein
VLHVDPSAATSGAEPSVYAALCEQEEGNPRIVQEPAPNQGVQLTAYSLR